MRHLDDMLGQTQILTSGVGDNGLPYLALLSSVPALSPTQEHNAWCCIMDFPWSPRELAGMIQVCHGMRDGALLPKTCLGGGRGRPTLQEQNAPKVRMLLTAREESTASLYSTMGERMIPGGGGCPGRL